MAIGKKDWDKSARFAVWCEGGGEGVAIDGGVGPDVEPTLVADLITERSEGFEKLTKVVDEDARVCFHRSLKPLFKRSSVTQQ